MDAPNAAITPDPDAMLAELANLGMRAARVVTRMLEIEQTIVEAVAACLPETGSTPASLSEAAASGEAIDAAAAAMAQAVPRTEALTRALDRISRSVRRSIALRLRIQAGWPRPGTSDNRPAMVRRQVARGVAGIIRQAADGEPAERLFDELAERLDDPALEGDLETLPVEEIVRRICRDLGLVAAALPPLASPSSSPAPRETSRRRFHGPPPLEWQPSGGSG